jgi:ABC-type multidrug transport system fused ATPase/permease subunit
MISPTAKPVDDIASLRGKNVLFGSASSTSGFIVPLGHLIDSGVTLKELGSWRNMEGGHTSVILSVANGEADAGFTWLPGIDLVETKNPGTAAKLHVVKLGTVPNDPVVVREGLDGELIAKIQKAFIEAIEDPTDGPIFKKLYFYDDFRVIEDAGTTTSVASSEPSKSGALRAVSGHLQTRRGRQGLRVWTTILDGVSLEIHEGEFVSIIGPSGAGKTTLCGSSTASTRSIAAPCPSTAVPRRGLARGLRSSGARSPSSSNP